MTDTKTYAYLLYQTFEGDDVIDDAFVHLRVDGFVDDNDEWVYDEDDD